MALPKHKTTVIIAVPHVRVRAKDADGDYDMPPARPHGSSLAMKPSRRPHPTAPGRDVFGRVMPAKIHANVPPPAVVGAMVRGSGALPTVPMGRAARPVPNVPPQPMPMAPSMAGGMIR